MKRIALTAAAGLVLAGCAGSHGTSSGRRPHSHYPLIGSEPVVLAASRLSPDLLRTHTVQRISPRRLAILTTGSSSCPSVPDKLVVVTPNVLDIHLAVGSWVRGRPVADPPPGGVCTADYGTTRMVLVIPRRIDVHQRLTVRISYPSRPHPQVWTVPPFTS
jgi:hypothetical protein